MKIRDLLAVEVEKVKRYIRESFRQVCELNLLAIWIILVAGRFAGDLLKWIVTR